MHRSTHTQGEQDSRLPDPDADRPLPDMKTPLKHGRGQGKRKGVSTASAQGLGAPAGTAKVTEVTAAGQLLSSPHHPTHKTGNTLKHRRFGLWRHSGVVPSAHVKRRHLS